MYIHQRDVLQGRHTTLIQQRYICQRNITFDPVRLDAPSSFPSGVPLVEQHGAEGAVVVAMRSNGAEHIGEVQTELSVDVPHFAGHDPVAVQRHPDDGLRGAELAR